MKHLPYPFTDLKDISVNHYASFQRGVHILQSLTWVSDLEILLPVDHQLGVRDLSWIRGGIVTALLLEELIQIQFSLPLLLLLTFNQEVSDYVVIGDKVLPPIEPPSIDNVKGVIKLVPICLIQ